ncbi:MAG: phosphoglycerate mutase family protein [Candidatus Binatia bacterium]
MKPFASFVKIAAFVIAGLVLGAPSPATAGKGVILLVRHAERVAGPATDDAPLTDAGKARAQRLAALLAKADIKSIFVTRFGRTQATAKPVADALRLTPIEESDAVQLVAKLRTHADETVLVVGHSDTVPDVIKALGGPSVTIGDDEFDDLFMLVPATGTLTRLKY